MLSSWVKDTQRTICHYITRLEWKTTRGPLVAWPSHSGSHCSVQVWDGQMGQKEKKSSLSIMKIGRTRDVKEERHTLLAGKHFPKSAWLTSGQIEARKP